MSILIRNVKIVALSEENREPFQGGILIEKDVISSIGQCLNTQADEVIDGQGMVALPGFVNAHTHAAMTLFRGYADDLTLDVWLKEKIWPLEAKLTPEDVYWGVKLALIEMIKGGITAFGDMYFFMEEEALAVEEAGIRASLSRGLVAAEGNAEQSLMEAEEFVSKWHNKASGRITAMFGPHAPYTCPPEFLKEVLACAKEKNVGIHIHLAETKKEVEDIQNMYGKTPTEYLASIGFFNHHLLAAHCVHLTYSDLEIFKGAQAYVVYNPQSNLKLGSGIAPVPDMLKGNIPVALGTDGAASNNNLDIFEEMRTAAILYKGICYDPTLVSAEEALEMATIAGAKALDLKRLGSLKPGNKADLILLNFNKAHLVPEYDTVAHIVYSAGAADVDTVIVDGQIIMQERQIKTIDETLVYQEVARRAKSLVNSIW